LFESQNAGIASTRLPWKYGNFHSAFEVYLFCLKQQRSIFEWLLCFWVINENIHCVRAIGCAGMLQNEKLHKQYQKDWHDALKGIKVFHA
jgi:hypothetical protein